MNAFTDNPYAPNASVPPINYNNFSQPPIQQPPQYATLIWSTGGENGALSYLLAPNSTAMFMDRDNPVIYVRSKDISGRELPIITYDLVKREIPKDKVQGDDLEERITAIVNNILDKRRESYKKNKEERHA